MPPKILAKFKVFLLLAIASFLALGLWIPRANAQLPNLWDFKSGSESQPSILYVKRGNIHIADVRLDGKALFKVAAPASDDRGELYQILPIEWRVNEIETRLLKIANDGFDPESLQVKTSILNNQTVIVIADRDWKQALMTVTELDRQIDSLSTDLTEIAETRAEIVNAALLKAQQERQPKYLQQQFATFLKVLAIAIASSLIIRQLQKFLKQQWRKLKRSPTEISLPERIEPEPLPKPKKRDWHSFLAKLRSQRLSIAKQQQINLTLRFIFWWGQITIWLAVSITGLLLFPQTRSAGVWLIGVPVSFSGILLGLGLVNKAIDIFTVYFLDKWSEQNMLDPNRDKRLTLRIPIISQVVQSVTLYLIISTGILLFLYAIRAPLTLVLVILGIVGFSAQNLIKDWIGGFLILWEDQYVPGDVVKINNITGLVECFNLRTTQLRNLDGELATIANGSFTTAVNLTYQWSQLNLGIEVAYSTDLENAIAIIKEVAETMRCDAVWKEAIVEPATILGVDGFGDNSITIRLLIKTQPMKQWDIGREYRYRLKQAFDRADITIPFPQRSIWFENNLMNQPNE